MKRFVKSVVAALAVLSIGFSAFAEVSDSEKCITFSENTPFGINWYAEGALLGAGIGGSAAAFVMKKTIDLPQWDGTKFDLSTVNPVDAFVAHPYNDSLHLAGTATCGTSLVLLPAGVFAAEALMGNLPVNELGKVGLMYAESFFMSYAIKDLLKVNVHRVRPYMYFDENDYEEGDNDWQFSFPSGHTTNAFLGAAFLSYVFCQYYPNSKFKIPVIAASYACAAGTGVLRMLSGNHFLTDVLTGAIIGTVCGIGVPMLHQYVLNKNSGSGSEENAGASGNVMPLGFSISFVL